MRMRKLYPAIVLALVLVACSSGESEEDVRFNENSPMFAIQEEGTLHVAVPGVEPFGSEETGEGFAVEFGRYIAEDLEVEAEFVSMDSSEMGASVADASVDIAFPLTALSYQTLRVEAVEQGYAFGSPYLIGHQRLLVPADPEVGGPSFDQLSDLDGKRICSYIDEATQVDVSTLVDADVIQVTSPQRCVKLLAGLKVDAATAADAHLATMKVALEERSEGEAISWEIVGDQLNTEGYAAMTLPGAMATYVIGELNDIEEEGLWLEYYNEWLEPHLGPVEGPPDLTLQDAASLFPPEPTPSPSSTE